MAKANDDQVLKVKGVMYWASLQEVNEMSGDYQFDFGNLSDPACAALEELGIDVKESKMKPDEDPEKYVDKGRFITCKSKNFPIKVYDKDGDEIFQYDNDGNKLPVVVGNGTEAICLIGAYPWTFKNKKGVSPSAKRVQITKLVPYERKSFVMDEEDVL